MERDASCFKTLEMHLSNHKMDYLPQCATRLEMKHAGLSKELWKLLAAISWAKSVGFIQSPKELEPLAKSVDDCGDVYFVPAFQGIFSPYWRDDARGLWIGLGSNTQKGHMARSMLEAPCLRTCEVVDCMAKDSGKAVTKMSVDGGMTVNDFMMQM